MDKNIIKHSKSRSCFSDLSDRDCIVIATLSALHALGLAIFTERGHVNISHFFKDTEDCREEKNLTSQVNGQRTLCQNKQWLLCHYLFNRKIQWAK